MANPHRWLTGWLTLLVLACGLATPAAGDEPGAAPMVAVPSDRDMEYEDRIAELERTVGVLATELERTRADVVVPEAPELKSKYGMGPAASKVFDLSRGLSIGGYGEINYTAFVNDSGKSRNTADALRGVLYFGYKFTESIVFNSEIEIEHADEIFLEFAEINFLWNEYVNAKAGLLLLPVGFLNEIHEPPFFFGVNRPDVERSIIPSTWRENGVGIFGSWQDLVQYKLYAVNGMDASGFSSGGLRGGRQKGSKTLAEHIAVVGRIDITPTPSTLIGASFYYGGSGQNQDLKLTAMPMLTTPLPDAETTLFEVHGQYKRRGVHLRGLFTMAFVDDAGALTNALLATNPSFSGAVAEQLLGGYVEAAYDIWPWLFASERSLEPFYRFEYYDTQHKMPFGFGADQSKQIRSHTVGLNFEPISNVVVKMDYRSRSAEVGKVADELNVGVGYVFWRALLGLLALTFALGIPGAVSAKVFFSRSEALELAFPDADRVESETYVLSEGQASQITELARSPLDSKLVQIYTGYAGDSVAGYAVIDVHNVRTLPEAFMVVLNPDGTVRSLRVLAFHEPLDYLPAQRWYEQFDAKTLAEPLRVGGDVHGVVGATLSARATTRGVRRVLAFYQVLIESESGR